MQQPLKTLSFVIQTGFQEHHHVLAYLNHILFLHYNDVVVVDDNFNNKEGIK